MTTAITRVTGTFPCHGTRRTPIRWLAMAALLGMVALQAFTPAGGSALTRQRIGVPAYYYPAKTDAYGNVWDRLIGPRSTRPATLVNPNTLGMVIVNPQDVMPPGKELPMSPWLLARSTRALPSSAMFTPNAASVP
jgi:hypothetical protein